MRTISLLDFAMVLSRSQFMFQALRGQFPFFYSQGNGAQQFIAAGVR